MAQKHNVFSINLIKKNGKLVHENDAYYKLYQEFAKNIEEGQKVEVFFDALKDDGNNAQLAKIHASIRTLAKELGYTFTEMKKTIKMESGLMWEGKDEKIYQKSFAHCSKEELGLVIECINHVGEMINVKFF